MRRFFRLPTPAIVVAIGALVLALGGTALARDLIGNRDIRNESIRGVDVHRSTLRGINIKNGTLHGGDFADGTIRSKQILDGTIQVDDLDNGLQKILGSFESSSTQRGATGPAGKNGADGKDGAPGQNGAPGKDGVSGYYVLNKTSDRVAPGTSASVDVSCKEGSYALGGGVTAPDDTRGYGAESDLVTNVSGPIYVQTADGGNGASGWHAVVTNNNATHDLAFLVWVSCATVR